MDSHIYMEIVRWITEKPDFAMEDDVANNMYFRGGSEVSYEVTNYSLVFAGRVYLFDYDEEEPEYKPTWSKDGELHKDLFDCLVAFIKQNAPEIHKSGDMLGWAAFGAIVIEDEEHLVLEIDDRKWEWDKEHRTGGKLTCRKLNMLNDGQEETYFEPAWGQPGSPGYREYSEEEIERHEKLRMRYEI